MVVCFLWNRVRSDHMHRTQKMRLMTVKENFGLEDITYIVCVMRVNDMQNSFIDQVLF